MDTQSGTLLALPTQLVIAGLVAYGVEWLKTASWFPWLTMKTKKLNRLVAAGLALAATIGVQFEYDAAVGALTVTGLSWASLEHGAWEYVKQLVLQQGWYDGIIAKKG